MLYPTLPPLPFVPRERKAALPVPSSLCWCVCLPISPSPWSSPLPPKASLQQVGSLAHLPVLEKGGGKGPSLVSQAFGLRQSPAVPRVPGREHPPPCWSWDLPLGLCSPPPAAGVFRRASRGGGGRLCAEGDQLWRWGDAVPGVVLCQWGAGGGGNAGAKRTQRASDLQLSEEAAEYQRLLFAQVSRVQRPDGCWPQRRAEELPWA